MNDEINPYLIKVSIRNNLIIKAIHKAGYKSVSQFCEQNGMAKTALTSLISLRTPPLMSNGEFRTSAKFLMETLCALPTELWTTEQLTMELKRNTSTKEVDLNAVVAALGMNSDEALQLIDESSPIKDLEDKEMSGVIADVLNTLNAQEQKVLRMRFGIGCKEHTLEEIGVKFDVTKERIRQIEAKALRKMKKPDRACLLRGAYV